MKISSNKRGGSGSKGFPLQEMRALMRDGRAWARLGVVYKPDGGAHYLKETDSDGKTRVMLEVQTIPEGEDLTCRLATKPLWYIPGTGSIVAVLVPSGELDHCPLVVGILEDGEADEDIAPTRCLLATEVDLVAKAPHVLLGGVDADHPVPQGDDQKAACDAFADAIVTYAGAIKDIADPTGLATAALTLAANAFKASSYLSSVSRTK